MKRIIFLSLLLLPMILVGCGGIMPEDAVETESVIQPEASEIALGTEMSTAETVDNEVSEPDDPVRQYFTDFSTYEYANSREILLTTIGAVYQYQTDHNVLPDSIEDLIPDYLPQILETTLSGNPIVYERDGDSFVLYLPVCQGIGDVIAGLSKYNEQFGIHGEMLGRGTDYINEFITCAPEADNPFAFPAIKNQVEENYRRMLFLEGLLEFYFLQEGSYPESLSDFSGYNAPTYFTFPDTTAFTTVLGQPLAYEVNENRQVFTISFDLYWAEDQDLNSTNMNYHHIYCELSSTASFHCIDLDGTATYP